MIPNPKDIHPCDGRMQSKRRGSVGVALYEIEHGITAGAEKGHRRSQHMEAQEVETALSGQLLHFHILTNVHHGPTVIVNAVSQLCSLWVLLLQAT